MGSLLKFRNKTNSNQPNDRAKRILFLDQLADIVGRIDHDKNEGGTKIIALTDRGMVLVSQMELESLTTGKLQDLFVSLQVLHDVPELLYELIDETHSEIENLLADDAWRVYAPD